MGTTTTNTAKRITTITKTTSYLIPSNSSTIVTTPTSMIKKTSETIIPRTFNLTTETSIFHPKFFGVEAKTRKSMTKVSEYFSDTIIPTNFDEKNVITKPATKSSNNPSYSSTEPNNPIVGETNEYVEKYTDVEREHIYHMKSPENNKIASPLISSTSTNISDNK